VPCFGGKKWVPFGSGRIKTERKVLIKSFVIGDRNPKGGKIPFFSHGRDGFRQIFLKSGEDFGIRKLNSIKTMIKKDLFSRKHFYFEFVEALPLLQSEAGGI